MAGRVVAVTGAGSGIGRAVARAFVEQGDIVHASDVSAARLGETVAELEPLGPVRVHVVDVADFLAVQGFVGAADEDGDGLAVFVSCAGVFDGYAGIEETTPELWHRVLDVNLTGCFHGCKAASAVMAPRGRGRIISIGSVAGVHGGADGLSYAASKSGIEGMTRRLAIDLGRSGITANVVAPGVISTAIRANSAEVLGDLVDVDRGVGTSSDKMDWLIPVGRPGRADEVAAAV
ncbi:MAG TPA: SDR family NAD(P)-dependent oxidoreductase, partial [Acidimicrobiales bacterium]|nr:SDR family NAD(P)-dependent oxidoreductase [Acidimicrobiales bacterium]